MSIRVMLADDQTLMRQGLRALLELSTTVTIVAEASDGAEVVRGVDTCKPDVLLLDIRMPVLTGIDALRRLQAQHQMVPTLILTTFDDEDLLLQAMDAGARGFLLKDVSLDILVHAIERVYAGGSYFQPAVTERILQERPRLQLAVTGSSMPEALTPKEQEVLSLMAGGYSNREIARAIYRSEGTVKNLVSVVLRKLGARDRTRAVLRAIDLGLLGKQ